MPISVMYLFLIAKDIRLINGAVSNEGVLEVRTLPDGNWGTVCDDGWYSNDARVACRQLGLNSSAVVAYRESHFTRSPWSFRLDDLNCVGDENSLFECLRRDRKSKVLHNYCMYVMYVRICVCMCECVYV